MEDSNATRIRLETIITTHLHHYKRPLSLSGLFKFQKSVIGDNFALWLNATIRMKVRGDTARLLFAIQNYVTNAHHFPIEVS